MAPKMLQMSLVAIFFTMLYASASARPSCTNTIISLSPCLNYITRNSSTPSSSCCSQLSTVMRSQPECLCQVLNSGGSSLELNINQTRALQLPNACNGQTPPISQCNAAWPADAPVVASDTPTNIPGNRSKTVPSSDVGSSNGSSNILPSTLVGVICFNQSQLLDLFSCLNPTYRVGHYCDFVLGFP